PGSNKGERFWEVTGVPLRDDQGRLTSVLKVAQDITERREAEQQIQEALQEKEILLREIHHRVKNNMQVISSLLKLNARFINNEQALLAFAESRNRIRAMALIHETLYQSDNMATIDLQEYVQRLVRNLIRVYDVHHDRIQVRIDTDDVSLNLEDATPVGLIINELLSNAFKYAFPGDREGEIVLSMRETTDEHIELTIRDNGIGMPQGMDIHQVKSSMGVQLVLGLVEGQLGGTINVKSDRGTTVSIVFQKKIIEQGEQPLLPKKS
ncbi:MAG: PAS domain-containing protein, partial [Desulfobulbaceae bacterium]|nr:PAS domain-containing protein [Desulfobulbaceae bacterium]